MKNSRGRLCHALLAVADRSATVLTMNPLQRSFDALRDDNRKALLPYVTAGYPDVATTVEILRRIDARACACVELGIPYSDPIADGPVIQTSFSRALEAGFRLDALLDAVRAARSEIDVPLVAMVSYSIVHRRSPDRFVETAVDAGLNGLIVPDLPIEEADGLAKICRRRDCPLVMIVTPTTGEARRGRIADLSQPFIYYQSLAGVTGERDRLPADLAKNVARLKAESGKPVCVGFGVSTPRQVADVCAAADGAIVGSAIVRRMNTAVDEGRGAGELVKLVTDFITRLASELPD